MVMEVLVRRLTRVDLTATSSSSDMSSTSSLTTRPRQAKASAGALAPSGPFFVHVFVTGHYIVAFIFAGLVAASVSTAYYR